MQFEENQLYHVYNQGNNRIPIFFSKANYQFFLKKIETHILPYAEIIAYCLMPNHFHLMIYVKRVERSLRQGMNTRPKSSYPLTKTQTLNQSIGVMLRSYTRAINKQENRSGSLFRNDTKAACLNSQSEYRKPFFTDNGITKINIQNN